MRGAKVLVHHFADGRLRVYPDSAKIRKSPLPIGVEAILLHS